MELNLITQNQNKVKEFRTFLKPGFKINHLNLDYPELRSDDPQEIVRLAAKSLSEKLQKTVIVEDSGFFIDSLSGFPGTCTAYIHKRIGVNGIIKIMENIEDRSCSYRSAIGICKPGHDPVSFLGIEKGIVSTMPLGNNGWGQDPIFIPLENNPDKKTYGQLRSPEKEDINLFRKQALEKLKEYLLQD